MMREVNEEHLLNYETDSEEDPDGSESGNENDDVLGRKMQSQKDELIMNDTWGKKRKSYHQVGSEEDDSEAEEDQLNEAKRLQAIRSRKLAK